nr:hypothetical protein [Tanacetum cinerariifolium]
DGDDEEESSEDDEDDEIDIEADKEEEEHPAPADSETEPFETDESAATPPPHPAYHMTARISILAAVPMPAWTDSEDTDEIYMRLDDEQTERQLLAGRLNMLFRDRRAHAYTHHLIETEARMSREAWVRA